MGRSKWTGLVAVAAVAAAAATATPALAASAPPGYTFVHGPELPVPASTEQASATVGCPLGTVVWGGGAGFFNFPGPSLTVDGTGPFGAGTWIADVDNLTGMQQQFEVDAVCANRPKGYRIVRTTVDNPGVTATTATANCPAGTVVLGGGVTSTSTFAASHMLSDWAPKHTAFRAIMWNGGPDDASMTVYAICAQQPPGYTIVRQSGDVPPSGLDFAGGECPVGTAVLSGGFRVSPATSGSRVATTLEDSSFAGVWDIDFINAGTTTVTLTTSAICAR